MVICACINVQERGREGGRVPWNGRGVDKE